MYFNNDLRIITLGVFQVAKTSAMISVVDKVNVGIDLVANLIDLFFHELGRAHLAQQRLKDLVKDGSGSDPRVLGLGLAEGQEGQN